MILILFGPPGAGKGTQAKFLEQKFNIVQLSTGDMLRTKAKDNDALAEAIKAIFVAGKLVSDDIMIAMIEDRIQQADCKNGFILDGFPRTVPQAEALDEMFAKLNLKLDAVIELKVDEEALVERITGRFTCAKCGTGYNTKFKSMETPCDNCGSLEYICRSDDNEETVRSRLKGYHESTEPVLPYYRGKSVLKTVDGMAPMDEVTKQIVSLF